EWVRAVELLGTEERPSLEDKWVRSPPVVCRPRPAQRPAPPVILGGMGPNVLQRVATWGDGWMPIGISPDALAGARQTLDGLARERGRDPRGSSLTRMIGAAPGLEAPPLHLLPPPELA